MRRSDGPQKALPAALLQRSKFASPGLKSAVLFLKLTNLSNDVTLGGVAYLQSIELIQKVVQSGHRRRVVKDADTAAIIALINDRMEGGATTSFVSPLGHPKSTASRSSFGHRHGVL